MSQGMSTKPAHNRLASETSPYLLQHAHQPVHWWPWCDEAFLEAAHRNIPILLSVGYSTCHWCHVMAHESFDDEATAAFMNEHFVCIKVDKEERPDIDSAYMTATQALTGQGGWPMTVFLTHKREPFYAGTYFPPQEMQGMPSFRRVLERIAHLWQTQPQAIQGNAAAVTEHLREITTHSEKGDWTDLSVKKAQAALCTEFDSEWGGFGEAPKFPSPSTLDFLLLTGKEGQEMARQTLRHMLAGGLYDQLGGGFHRYSVDRFWHVPHFEKMLYDNAHLLKTLLWAHSLWQEEDFGHRAQQTLNYLLQEMRHERGGFFSASDADTPTENGGVEGLTYTWTISEIKQVLTEAGLEHQISETLTAYGMDENGRGATFRDPHQPQWGTRLLLLGHSPAPTEAQQALFRARQQRPQPHIDRKILTSWNGLLLIALAEAARVFPTQTFDSETALDIARKQAHFLWNELRDENGRLHHVWTEREGRGKATVTGLLEDHALLGLGLYSLYRVTGEESCREQAAEIHRMMVNDFWDEEEGIWRSWKGEELPTRGAGFFDAGMISDNAAAALFDLSLAPFTDEYTARKRTERVLSAFAPHMARPYGLGGLWQVAALHSATPIRLTLSGNASRRRNWLAHPELWNPKVTIIHEENTGKNTPKEKDGIELCIGTTCLRLEGEHDWLEKLRTALH